jgi:hypothetical protein
MHSTETASAKSYYRKHPPMPGKISSQCFCVLHPTGREDLELAGNLARLFQFLSNLH